MFHRVMLSMKTEAYLRTNDTHYFTKCFCKDSYSILDFQLWKEKTKDILPWHASSSKQSALFAVFSNALYMPVPH